MNEYDDAEDIEALLRSAVRGDPSNNTSSTTDDEHQPDADDSATRRRRIRLGENALGSLQRKFSLYRKSLKPMRREQHCSMLRYLRGHGHLYRRKHKHGSTKICGNTATEE